MLVAADLADAINQALGPPTDKDGNPITTTAEMMAYADAVLTLQAATFVHVAGLVTGIGAPTGPMSNGAAANGVITGLSAATWAGILAAAFTGATSTAAEAGASTGYIMSAGKVNFAPNTITGNCTATPSSPGILANGAGSNGTIDMLDGSAWATAVLSAIGLATGPLAADVYNAVADYIAANAECSYTVGSVVGTFAAGGGPLVAGAGVGGIIA